MDKKKRNKIVALAVAIVVVIAGIIAIAANSTAINIKLTYLMMPKTLTQPIGDKSITFYVRESKDFDAKKQKDSPLEAFEFYYYDDEGNEVNLGSDGVYTDGDTKIMPSMLFMLGAMKNSNNFKSTYLPIIITVLVIVALVVGIVLWYKSWSKKENMEKAAKHKNNINRKRK